MDPFTSLRPVLVVTEQHYRRAMLKRLSVRRLFSATLCATYLICYPVLSYSSLRSRARSLCKTGKFSPFHLVRKGAEHSPSPDFPERSVRRGHSYIPRLGYGVSQLVHGASAVFVMLCSARLMTTRNIYHIRYSGTPCSVEIPKFIHRILPITCLTTSNRQVRQVHRRRK